MRTILADVLKDVKYVLSEEEFLEIDRNEACMSKLGTSMGKLMEIYQVFS